MTTATVTAPAWTDDDRELSTEALGEGLHFIYDTAIAGYWVTTRGVPNERIEGGEDR